MDRSRARAPLALMAAIAVAASMLTGCSAAAHGGEIPAAQISTDPDTSRGPAAEEPSLTVADDAPATRWRPDQPIVVNAVQGTLRKVTVTAPNGSKVGGTLSDDHRHWTSTDALAPGTTYKVRARMVGGGGDAEPVSRTARITTVENATDFRALISPRDGATVGVGMPILVTFTSPVADQHRAAVERSLTVTSSEPAEGSWSWVSPTQVQYRPRDYWPAKTKVSVRAALTGVPIDDGVWGTRDRTVDFTIGRSVISVVDVSTHEMTVTINGKLARTIPVTTGKEGFRTRGGTRVISEKLEATRMDAETTGIRPGSAEYYNLDVKYAMRMTKTGEFVHAAPWSVDSQGHANVSHGCVGMSIENAKWLFERSRVGDLVTIVNSKRPLEPGNGLTQWNVAWEDWTAGSAL